jgi:hypothetical protein
VEDHVTWLGWYWAQVGGNVLAIPVEAVITLTAGAVSGWVFRRPLGRLARWARREFHAETHAAIDDLRRVVDRIDRKDSQ